jgi:hypothetical protein
MRAGGQVAHTHPCLDCGTPLACEGTYERNHDGWPEAICTAYHGRHGLTNPYWVCEACRLGWAARAEADRLEDSE